LKIEENLALAVQQLFGHLLARDAQRLGGGVEVEAVPPLVLHLGQQGRLAAQAGRAGDPVALGQHADDFRVRVLADLADQRAAIAFGHLVVGLDLFLGVDARLEAGEEGLVLGASGRRRRSVPWEYIYFLRLWA
jgi:hypothetical protein